MVRKDLVSEQDQEMRMNVVKENLYSTDMEAMKKYNDARLEEELIAHLPK